MTARIALIAYLATVLLATTVHEIAFLAVGLALVLPVLMWLARLYVLDTNCLLACPSR